MLTAPFPFAGGKRHWAAEVWRRYGSPDVYAEPFAGSLAVLLGKPDGPAKREVVCDLNGSICNFWRAVQRDPEAVAHHADRPTYHRELTAARIWHRRWLAEHADWLAADLDYCDPKAAGIWAWGVSVSIRGQFDLRARDDRIPFVDDTNGGQGCSRQVRTLWKRAQGIQIPQISNKIGGSGVSRSRLHRPELAAWMQALGERLANVIVLNRGWKSCLTPTVLSERTDAQVAILMDPPYAGSEDAYGLPVDGETAAAAFAWSVEHGSRFRIAYCAHVGDFDVPEGWEALTGKLSGVRNDRGTQDMIMFSPACAQPRTEPLFGRF